MNQMAGYSLMVHGGAGALDNVKDPKTAVRYLESIRCVLEHGRQVLTLGGSALQAVEACASLLEDDPVFNAGCGSVLNENGKVEMDAAIMDGRDLSAGAVAAVDNIANPVQLARYVMTESEHVMLIAEGAMRFADHCGMVRVPENYFYTPDRVKQLEEARLKHKVMLDHDDTEEDSEDQKYGTICRAIWRRQLLPVVSLTNAWDEEVIPPSLARVFMPIMKPVQYPPQVMVKTLCVR